MEALEKSWCIRMICDRCVSVVVSVVLAPSIYDDADRQNCSFLAAVIPGGVVFSVICGRTTPDSHYDYYCYAVLHTRFHLSLEVNHALIDSRGGGAPPSSHCCC